MIEMIQIMVVVVVVVVSTDPLFQRMIAYSEISSYNSFQIKKDTIVVKICLLIMNQTPVRLVHDQKENFHYDRIPVNF